MVAATKTAGAVPSSERQLLGRADLNKREIQEITMTADPPHHCLPGNLARSHEPIVSVSFRICYSSILVLCRPKRRRPVHFLVTRQRRSGASVAAILGRIASHDRSTRQRNFGIEAAPLRSQHCNLTKGLSSRGRQ